jgi:hypothetical protein
MEHYEWPRMVVGRDASAIDCVSIAVLLKPGCAGHLLACAPGLHARFLLLSRRNPQGTKVGRGARRTHAFAIPSDRRIKARIGREWMNGTRGIGAYMQHLRRKIKGLS